MLWIPSLESRKQKAPNYEWHVAGLSHTVLADLPTSSDGLGFITLPPPNMGSEINTSPIVVIDTLIFTAVK